MSSSDRRTFVKRAATAAGTAAAASLVPAPALGHELGRWVSELGLTWERSPCPLCGVGCGLLVGLEGGRAVAVRADADAPVNRGLACARGYHSIQALYGGDRSRAARVRRGGAMVEVPVAEALDLVAARLRETVEAHGKDAVGVYGSRRWTIPAAYAAAKLFKGGIGTNNVDSEARLYGGSTWAGALSTFGLDGATGCFEDIDHADVFVLWGTNVAELHPVLFSRMLAQRRERPGVRIVDVATRTTRTSYPADRALLYAPGSDAALANALCQEIVARGRANGNFLARHVAFLADAAGEAPHGPGSNAGDAVPATYDDYVRFLSAYAPERAEGVTWMGAADIRWLASLYAEPGLRVMTLWDGGVNGSARGTWINNLLYNLHLLVGKIAVPGSGPMPLGLHPADCAAVGQAGALAETLPGGLVERAADRERTGRIWGVPVERLDPRPGRGALSLFQGLETGDVRLLWVQGANPMAALPDADRYRRAASQANRFIIVSDAYPTATTAIADVVLPSALWIEEEGVFGSGERRTQHHAAMLPPPGDAMAQAWQTIEVARRLGFGDLFRWDAASHVAGLFEEYGRFRTGAAAGLPPFPDLADAPGLLWPWVDGRETRWRYATDRDPAASPARGDFDFYGQPDHRARIWLRPQEPPAEAPDSEFPLWLTTGGVLEHGADGTLTGRIPTLRRAVPRAYAELGREDATALGVRDGDRVRLTSRRGSLVLEARVEYRSQPPRGQVFVPSFDETVPVNTLLPDVACPISGQPGTACAVRLERLPGGSS